MLTTMQEQLASAHAEIEGMSAAVQEAKNKLTVATELEDSARQDKTVAENRLGKCKKANAALKKKVIQSLRARAMARARTRTHA